MARYVIDAPTLLHVIDHDLTIDPGHQFVARNAIRSDALQLLLDAVRAGTRDEKNALAVHQRVTELKMRLLGDRVSRSVAWQLAWEHGWTDLRGAESLAITRLQADALVTVDPELAARAEGVVPVADVEVLGRPG